MANFSGSMKADLLIRWHGSSDEPTVIATVDLPIHSVPAEDGKATMRVDASVFERVGKALAAALEDEMDPQTAVMLARQRLAEAQKRLARGA